MFKIQAIIFAFFFTLIYSTEINCQTSADEKLLVKITTELALDSNQVHLLKQVFNSHQQQLDSLNKLIKEIQTGEYSEDVISKKTSILFRERKELRSWKSNQISINLTADQKQKYDTQIVAKNRPVIHFGHDKANCKACLKPGDPRYIPKP